MAAVTPAADLSANTPYATPMYSLIKTVEAPHIDGSIDDLIWQGIPTVGQFIQSEPVENAQATFQTDVKILYTNNAIYFAAFCHDPEPDKILRQLGTRDDNLNADRFRIDIDPYDAQQDYTSFWVTASGVQGDSKFSDRNFNAVWESAVTVVEDGWIAEIKIPYSALRFPSEDEQQWSLQMYRHIRRLQEYDTWAPTKRENSNAMDYFGKLTDIRDIDPPVRLSLTPYINFNLESRPDENGDREFDWAISGGADLKYGINESFTLDMTLLPDFSQVQSDDNINNLSAFETIFDEQRTFFQEGVDLFERNELFYSRRIGSGVANPNAPYDDLGEGEEIIDNPETSKLLNAFKISGRTTRDVGIGVFNAIEGRSYATIREAEDDGTYKVQTDPLSNYNIFVLEKNFKNNRSMYGINTNVTRTDGYRNGNVAGGGFSANFANNQYNVRGHSYYSVVNEKVDGEKRKRGYRYQLDFDKVSGNWRYGWRTEGTSGNYDPNDLGVNFQTDFLQHGWSTNYNVYEPMKHVRYLNTLLFLNFRQHLPTKELSSITLNLNANTTFTKTFTSVYGGVFANVYGEKDYYEARTPGQVFRQPKFADFYVGVETDSRKKLSLYVEGNATVSPDRGGSYNLRTYIQPHYRPNDHLSFTYSFSVYNSIDDIGYATRSEGVPIFGKRDILNYTNVFSGNYIIRNDLSVGVRARHYWSRVDYSHYYELTEDGNLKPTLYADFDNSNNINYNTFNIDLLFNWEFAPGSALSVSYKNNIFDYRSDLEGNMFDNLRRLFDQTQTNTVSVRLIYYLDYNTVRGWAGKRKNRPAEG